MNSFQASAPVGRAYVSSDGTGALLVLTNGTAELRSLSSGALEKTWTPAHKLNGASALTRTNNLAAIPTAKNTIALFHVGDAAAFAESAATGERAGAIAFAPNAKFLAAAYSEERLVRLYDTATGKAMGEFPGGIGGNSALVISPDHRYLAVAAYDTSFLIYNLATGKLERSYDQFPMALFCATYTADSQAIYGGSADGRLYRIAGASVEILAQKLPANISELLVLGPNRMVTIESDPLGVARPTELKLWEKGERRILAKLPKTPYSLDWHKNRLLLADGTAEVRWLEIIG